MALENQFGAYSRLVLNSLFSKDPAWLFEPEAELKAVREGSKVYVKSRTRPGLVHVVDLEEETCTCEGFQYYGRCWHLDAAEYSEAEN